MSTSMEMVSRPPVNRGELERWEIRFRGESVGFVSRYDEPPDVWVGWHPFGGLTEESLHGAAKALVRIWRESA